MLNFYFLHWHGILGNCVIFVHARTEHTNMKLNYFISTATTKKSSNSQQVYNIITAIVYIALYCKETVYFTTTSYDSILAIMPLSRSFSCRVVRCELTLHTKFSTEWICKERCNIKKPLTMNTSVRV